MDHDDSNKFKGSEGKRKSAPVRSAHVVDGEVRTSGSKPAPLGAVKAGIELVADLVGPNGGVSPRCQALVSDRSRQCGRPARRGFRVCSTHGAGTAKREGSGERKRAGRPPIHGLYSKRGVADVRALMDTVRDLKGDVGNTDEELIVLRAVLWFLLEQTDSFASLAHDLDAALEGLRGGVMTGGWEAVDAKAFARGLSDGHRLMSKLDGFVDRLSDAAVRVITMSKARAEVKAKLAESIAMEQFSLVAVGIRDIVWDLLDDDERLVFEERVRRELFMPARVEPPAELGGRGSSALQNLG